MFIKKILFFLLKKKCRYKKNIITNDINKDLFEKKAEAINPKYNKLYPAKKFITIEGDFCKTNLPNNRCNGTNKDNEINGLIYSMTIILI